MLITEEYREQNKLLHESRVDYGANGKKWANLILDMSRDVGSKDVLDYGCGKGSLAKSIPVLNIKGYDPAVEEYSNEPEPADMVVFTDVAEHIEPECLDAVLDDLQRLTKKMLMVVVSNQKAVKILADGRNAHLTVEPYSWWLPKFWERFDIVSFQNLDGKESLIVCKAKQRQVDA